MKRAGALLALFLLLLTAGVLALRRAQSETLAETDVAPHFEAIELDFTHVADLDHSLPFAGAAAFDLDGDGHDELFLGGGRGQEDAIFAFRAGRFERIANATESKPAPDATHGAAAIDLDGDRRDELLLARESGVWLCANRDRALDCARLDLDLDADVTPLSIALGDINRDGLIDFYVSGYVSRRLVEGETVFRRPYGGYSYFFVGQTGGGWRDETEAYGLRRRHNTFAALFADLDNDADADLVIAQDTGRVEMYENMGAPPMRAIANPSVYSYPMGIAAGDVDNDGLIDLYFSNVGHTLPEWMLRGDLRAEDPFNPDYMLFHNEGRLAFADRAAERGLARLGFGWGVVFADMDLDGRQDALAAQNYARLPLNPLMLRYPGKLMLQQADGGFASAERAAGIENYHFGLSPIVADFDGDLRPDLVWLNLNGPARAFLNRGPTGAAIGVRLPNRAFMLGARIAVRAGDTHRFAQVIANQGLGADQSRTQIIGLGAAERADEVVVTLSNGAERRFENVAAGAVLRWDGTP
ncbi:MAG TPA: hypothetical protein DHW63_05825 [Hyphomonadaceae bacterium]|nr:hypothetical protein [Hyphomonadaceae bacterium]